MRGFMESMTVGEVRAPPAPPLACTFDWMGSPHQRTPTTVTPSFPRPFIFTTSTLTHVSNLLVDSPKPHLLVGSHSHST